MKMDRFFQILERSSHTQSPPPPPPAFLLSPPPPPPIFQAPHYSDLESKISPSILLIIVILAIIFFVSGVLHLLVRFLLRPNNRDPDELDTVTALQGQLQQLFHLHDSGVDQSFIDSLPVFHYKAIIGVKDPFDCAVCLSEFEPEDKLRLLPKCSHAFHVDCIDTWLLSHSTCPLCRSNLLDFSQQNGPCTPFVCVLESGSESSRETNGDRDGTVFGSNRHLGSCRIEAPGKSGEITVRDDVGSIVTVKLGKFKNVDGAGESSSNLNTSVKSRRCYSMGSFAYVMDDDTSFQVPIKKMSKKKKKGFPPLNPGQRSAISEYGSDSRRELNAIDGKLRSESFSVSKIWVKKEKGCSSSSSNVGDSSKRGFSFRLPMRGSDQRSISEVEFGEWDNNGGSEMGCWGEDEETRSNYSVESSSQLPQTTSSSTGRTLLWLMGRQQVAQPSVSISSNV